MADKPWKAFERRIARLFGGKRHTANQGGRVDVTGAIALVQCKEVQVLSLDALTILAEELERLGADHQAMSHHLDPPAVLRKPMAGVVAVKVRRGRGHPSPTLIVMTAEVFDRWYRHGVEKE